MEETLVIEIKATGPLIPAVSFIKLYKGVLTFHCVVKFLSVTCTMQMKATEQNFPVVLSIMRNNSNLNFLLLGDKGLELNATMKVTTS